ncbi:hypothetical protein ACFL09_04835 [Planctomycetota bacterium]
MRKLVIVAVVALVGARACAEGVAVLAGAHQVPRLVTHERLTFAPGLFLNEGLRGGPTIARSSWLGFYWPLATRVETVRIVRPWRGYAYVEWHGRDGGYWNRTLRRSAWIPSYRFYQTGRR